MSTSIFKAARLEQPEVMLSGTASLKAGGGGARCQEMFRCQSEQKNFSFSTSLAIPQRLSH